VSPWNAPPLPFPNGRLQPPSSSFVSPLRFAETDFFLFFEDPPLFTVGTPVESLPPPIIKFSFPRLSPLLILGLFASSVLTLAPFHPILLLLRTHPRDGLVLSMLPFYPLRLALLRSFFVFARPYVAGDWSLLLILTCYPLGCLLFFPLFFFLRYGPPCPL